MEFNDEPLQNWICPSDRQLALRAQLKTGWCVKSNQFKRYGNQTVPLDPVEKEMICAVIKRAEALDLIEQERVGRLIDRLDNMKKNAVDSGSNQCILCGCKFGVLSSQCLLCHDCKKCVCNKCGVENSTLFRREVIWRCKICAETREIWKKSGAWFFKGLPKYILPQKRNGKQKKYSIKNSEQLPKTVGTKQEVVAEVHR